MSELNITPSSMSTTSVVSVDSSSDSGDESENSILMQDGISPPSLCSDQGKDQMCPVVINAVAEILAPYWLKPHSPAASYISMKSNQSIDPPLKFSHKSDVTDVMGINGVPSPAPTQASLQSDHSMDPPPYTFNHRVKSVPSPRTVDSLSPRPTSVQSDQSVDQRRTIKKRVSYTSLMMMEHLKCSLCKNMLTWPVSIPCGHSFCKSCIRSYWKKSRHAGSYGCPECKNGFKTRPLLKLNVTLANVVQTQQTGFSPPLLPQSYAGPGDVACDICTGSKIRAVKSCRTCCKSYCETHVREHYTVEALQKHTLIEPTVGLEQGVAANTPAEPNVPKDLINQFRQLQNKVNDMEVKMEVLSRRLPPVQNPAKRRHAELEDDFVSQSCDFTVPDQQLLHK